MAILSKADLAGLAEASTALAAAGNLEQAEEMLWRGVATHPYSAALYLSLAGVIEKGQSGSPLAAALLELGLRKLDASLEYGKPVKDAPAPLSTGEQPDLAEAWALARQDETPEVNGRLRPHRIIHELIVSAEHGLLPDLVRQILADGAKFVPLLAGVIRGWADELLPTGSNGPARVSLALLGEIGDVAAIPIFMDLAADERKVVATTARWAWVRLMVLRPQESAAALQDILETRDVSADNLAVYAVSRLPEDHPARTVAGGLGLPTAVRLSQKTEESISAMQLCTANDEVEQAYSRELSEAQSRRGLGRNDPCWCGSGKKYKKCHLALDEQSSRKVHAMPKPDNDARRRREALDLLSSRISEQEFLEAARTFIGEFEPPENEIPIMEWILHDYNFPRLGHTILQEYINRNRSKLSQTELNTLEKWTRAPISLYEVQDVWRGEGVIVRDVLRGGNYFVRDISSSRNSSRWDLILIRLMRASNGRFEFTGAGIVVSRDQMAGLCDWVIAEHGKSRQSLDEFLKANAHRIRHRVFAAYDELQANRQILTPEGDEVMVAKSVWRFTDLNAVRNALGRSSEFDETPDGFVWLEPPKDLGGSRRVLGQIHLQTTRLMLECMSRERLERGKHVIDSLLGDLLTHDGDKLTSMESFMREGSKGVRPVPAAKRIPEDSGRQVLEEMMAAHYRSWPDKPLPALEGETPREAMKTEQGRRRLEELLKLLENGEERKRLHGEPWFDMNILRTELGLQTK